MNRQLGKIERKKNGSHVGTFFFGSFIGFLVGILLIAGLCAFFYFNVSINWINKTFKQDIGTNNEELDNLTLNEFVRHTYNLANNFDSYTLNNLKSDFGIDIGDEIAGIDISDLKSVPFSELRSAVADKISNISAEELKDALDPTLMEDVFNKSITYYYSASDGQLYKSFSNEIYSDPVGFDYSLGDQQIIVKGHAFYIYDNMVDITLRYLPLTSVIADYDKTIEKMQLAEIFGYDIVNDIVLDNGVEVQGILGTIAKYTVDEFVNGNVIDRLTLAEVFYDQMDSGVLSLIDNPNNIVLDQIPSAISDALTTSTIGELIEKEIVSAPSNYDDIKDKYINVNIGTALQAEYKLVSDLQFQDIINVAFALLEDVDGVLLDQIPTA